MKEEPKKTTNIAGLTAEEAYAITFVLSDSLRERDVEFKARKVRWEEEYGKPYEWGVGPNPDAETNLKYQMVKMQEERTRLCELALDAFGEKVMGFKRRIGFPDSGNYT